MHRQLVLEGPVSVLTEERVARFRDVHDQRIEMATCLRLRCRCKRRKLRHASTVTSCGYR